jgi:hypothetical protein
MSAAIRLPADDGTGHPMTAVSNAFGYYRFSEVQSGRTYILNATQAATLSRREGSVCGIFAHRVLGLSRSLKIDFCDGCVSASVIRLEVNRTC